MNIKLGNLTIFQFEERIGHKLSEEDRDWLKEHKQENAQHIKKNKLHIFDIPFCIIVGSEISNDLVEMLKKYDDIKQFKEELQILESE